MSTEPQGVTRARRGRIFYVDGPREYDSFLNACVGRNTGTHDNAVGYSGGFQSATEAMLRLLDVPVPPRASEEWGMVPLMDMLVYPICYCARHHVELVLKASIPKAWTILTIKKGENKQGMPEPRRTETTHSLLKVFDQLHAICEKADSRLADLTTAIRPYVKDIDSIDASGQTFRYAKDAHEGKPHLDEVSHINLQFFADGYAELCELLQGLEGHLDWLKGEYLTDTFTSKLNRSDLHAIAARLPPAAEWSSPEFDAVKMELCKDYELSSNDFSRACTAIKNNRALAGLVGITLPVKHVSEDVFQRLRAASQQDSLPEHDLTLDARSTVLGLLRVGSERYFPEELDSFVRPLPNDNEEAGVFENERELSYLARKVAQRPDLVERALELLGQPDLLTSFRQIYYKEIQARVARLADSKKWLDGAPENSPELGSPGG